MCVGQGEGAAAEELEGGRGGGDGGGNGAGLGVC